VGTLARQCRTPFQLPVVGLIALLTKSSHDTCQCQTFDLLDADMRL
jgi:hypothetical protein